MPTSDRRAGSLEAPRSIPGALPRRTATPTGLVPIPLRVILPARARWDGVFGQHSPRLASETIAVIQQMARENCLWGVEPRRRVPGERIRGELMKLGIRVPSLPRIGRPGVDDPEIRPPGSPPPRPWSDLVSFPRESRPDRLGL
jgi:hypothetical protein